MIATEGPPRTASAEVVAAHAGMLGVSRARSRHLALRSGQRVHILEAGAGVPALLLHGSNTSSLSSCPRLEQLEGVRAIAVDRPGFGVSERDRSPGKRYRDGAVEFIDEVARALELEHFALAGNSMGGTWGCGTRWRAPNAWTGPRCSGRPRSCPAARVPPPLRVAASPLIGDVLARVPKPTPANGRPPAHVDGPGRDDRPLPRPDRVGGGRRSRPARCGRRISPSCARASRLSGSGDRRGCTRMSCDG